MSSSNGTNRSLLADLIGCSAVRDGLTRAPVPGITFLRASGPSPLQAWIYEPSIVLVAQGQKQTHLAGHVYTYDAQHYLILSVPLPVQSQVRIATPEAPFLSLKLSIDPADLSALILEMDDGPLPSEPLEPGISASPVPKTLYDATVRLLQAMHTESDRQILAPLYIREILYRALNGPQGHALRAIALRHGQQHRIAHVLNLIHNTYDTPLDVPSLAAAAGMSVSTFHRNFKAVTSLAPLQYVKTIRLHKARSLLLYEGLNAGEAAYRVGYHSASQFSREFRRLFGLPPTEEVARLHAMTDTLDEETAAVMFR